MVEMLQAWLNETQHVIRWPTWLVTSMVMACLLIAGGALDFILHRGLISLYKVQSKRPHNQLYSALAENRIFRYLAHLSPGLLFYYAIPLLHEDEPLIEYLLFNACLIYIGLFVLLLLFGLTNMVAEMMQSQSFGRRIPVRSLQQLTKLVMTIIFALFLVGLLLNKNPLYLISGLGAFTAILLLVFRDTILGFVGGIQLAANDMIRPGDWVEMPKYGADGNVVDVGLTTVKIQNWDKTITTVPTHAMISDAFKNWRGMENAQGRRIKRAIHLDLTSIGFLNDTQWQELTDISLIATYLGGKRDVLALQGEIDGHQINRRQLTNIGTFRAYLIRYLTEHPKINQDMTLLVRQLKSTEHGLPLEIYCFCRDKSWANYEAVQADIFDHIYAVLPSFGLRPYQLPTGSDLSRVHATVD